MTGKKLAAEARLVSHNVFTVFPSERTTDEKSGAAGLSSSALPKMTVKAVKTHIDYSQFLSG